MDCIRGGQVVASYPLAYGLTAAPPPPPDLIATARESLILEGHVKPPFDFTGFEFRIRNAQ